MNRNTGLDLLRILCLIFVICGHTVGTYVDMMKNGIINVSYGIVILMVLCQCVNVFFLISGAFLLSNNDNANYRLFYRKKGMTILIPTLIFSILYVLYSMITPIVKRDAEAAIFVLKEALCGRPFYHLWYLYTFIVMLIFVPIIIRIRNVAGERVFDRLAILIFISSSISNLTSTHLIQYDPGSVYRYIGYLFIGYSIYSHRYKSNKTGIAVIITWVILVLLESYINYLQYSSVKVGPLAAALAIILEIIHPLIIFRGFSLLDLKTSVIIEKITALGFLIYIFHAGIRDLLIRLSTQILGEDVIFFILPVELNAIALSLFIMFASLMVAFLYNPIQRKVESHYHIRRRIYDFLSGICHRLFGAC